MAARSLNSSESQVVPAPTEFFVVSQSNHVSVPDILFGVLAIILAVASVLLAYLQLVHMRRSPKLDVEMFPVRKYSFSTSYTPPTDDRLEGPSRQDSYQSSVTISDEAPQEDQGPILHSTNKVK